MNSNDAYEDVPRGLERREFLSAGAGAAVGLAGAVGLACRPPDAPRRNPVSTFGGGPNTEASLDDNIYTRLLGVRPHLGAHEHITTLGGCRMPPEIMQAMVEANDYFVDMHELTAAAGKRVAELMGAEAALITAGGFSAMLLGAAACLTGTDQTKMEQLPHPTWPKRDCVIQMAHRFSYDNAYSAAGMNLVYAETREGLIERIDENTAMLAAVTAVERGFPVAPPKPRNRTQPPDASVIMPVELIDIGKQAGVPVLIDAASDLPPRSNLTRYIDAGADLVVISGGKGLLGPQSTGILAGRRALIEAAALQASPNDHIGRGMKVGKEEIIALVVALERFVALDEQGEIARWNTRARRLADALQGIPGVSAAYAVNTSGYADVDLSWDEAVVGLSQREVKQRLRDGVPRVIYDGTTVRTRLLRDGEEILVATRVREVFER
ncbi:MAG: aminotransferase class V-fold PLP-dependent enzyme [Gemmatimonadetes bacterium]|nr:aminotransferase class V-fold PLP-dependent enzyme [Gemmatimonadota bacterium]